MKPFGFLILAFCFACQNKPEQKEIIVVEEESLPVDLSSIGKEKLSEYNFFAGELKNLHPAEDVVPYDLNSPLFSDYAFKKRFVRIPTGKTAAYDPNEVFEFPEGTTLIKNFYYQLISENRPKISAFLKHV